MIISTLVLFALIPTANLSPPGNGCDGPSCKRTQEADGSDPKRMKLDTNDTTEPPTCLYRGGRRSVDGKIIRSDYSKVSNKCTAALTKLSDLASPSQFLGTESELQLILARGSATFSKDFNDPEILEEYSDQYICSSHRDELSLKWTDRSKYNHYLRSTTGGKPKCSYPDEYHGDKRPVTAALNAISSSVTFEEAKAVFTLESKLVPIGLPVCPHHKAMQQEAVAKMRAAEGTLSPSSPSGGSLRSGADHHPSGDSTTETSTVDPRAVIAFRAFATAANESRLTGWKPLAKMDKRSVQKKTNGIRRLVDLIFEIAGKDDKQKLAEMVMASRAAQLWQTKRTSSIYDELMRGVAERFYNTAGRREKELALAMVAFRVPLREIRVYIPGLSERLYYKAKRMSFVGIKVEHEKYLRVRFAPAKLAHFISYITSPLIMSDLPFGEKKVVAADGRKYKIPNSLRLQRATEIVHMYTNMMKERNLEHLLFSKSTLFKILSYCSATERKAAVCVDYLFAESELAFGDLNELLQFLYEKMAVTKEWKEETEAKLKEVRFYYKGDYRIHTRNHSRVASHCWVHSLSDMSNPKLSAQCDSKVEGETHFHDLKCDRCEMGKSVLEDLKLTLDEFEKEVDKMSASDQKKTLKEDIDDWRAKLEQSQERIENYKSHQLRSEYSSKVHEQMVAESETDEESATVILDFSQKWLPAKHLEAQSDYFGKRGLSIHVSHVQTRRGGRIAQHLVYHIINTDQQDSTAVIQIIGHLLGELKKVGLSRISLRSDNAAAYHCASTIGAVYQLALDAKVHVRLYGFSEVQNGKSAADRGSGLFKNKVRAYVNAGGDAATHEELFTAATSGRLIEGASIYLVSTELKKAPTVKIDKVSEYYDFHYDYEKKGIRMWRHRNIGEGVFLAATSFGKKLSPLPKLAVIKSGGHLPENSPNGVGYWKLSPILAATCPKEELPSLLGIAEKKQFHCPEITCSSSFDSEEELEAHWLTGIHCSFPMTTTLRDESLRMFSAGLENAIDQRLKIPEVDDVLDELQQSDSDAEENEEAGWAIKTRKATVRFTDRAKKYIEKLFDEGIALKKKIQPEEAERRMASERANGVRVFSVEERLNARQIASLYSRIASAREAAGATAAAAPRTVRGTRHARNAATTAEGSGGDQEEEIDENAIFEDPWYYDSHDLVVLRIMEARAEIFDLGQEVEVDNDEIMKKHSSLRARRHHRHHHRHSHN